MFRLSLVVSCLLLAAFAGQYACNAQSGDVVYKQHWQSPEVRTPYASGTIVPSSVIGEACPVDIELKIAVDSHVNAPNNGEWKHGSTSKWDVSVQRNGGTWNTQAPQITPYKFVDNTPGGTRGVLEVTVKIELDGAASSTNSLNFEVYGNRTGLNVSPPNSSEQAMIAIPGTINWTLDGSKTITALSVQYGTIRQAKNLDGLGGGSWPARKSVPRGSIRVSEPEVSREATLELADAMLFGAEDEDRWTNHFSFENRVGDRDPDPPTTFKYKCLVECLLEDGSREIYSNSNLRQIAIADWRLLQLHDRSVRVVRCRFSWRMLLTGERTTTEWVTADEGYFFSNVNLVWHGENSYEIIPALEKRPNVEGDRK